MRHHSIQHQGFRARSGILLAALIVALVGQANAQLIAEDIAVEEQLVSPEIEQIFNNAQELFQSVDQAQVIKYARPQPKRHTANILNSLVNQSVHG